MTKNNNKKDNAVEHRGPGRPKKKGSGKDWTNNMELTPRRASIFGGLKTETRYTIMAVIFFAAAVFFFLASQGAAGRAGDFIYKILNELFGAGYYLIPLIFILLGISFIRSMKPNFMASKIASGLIFFVASLGLVAIIAGNAQGGALGALIASPLLALFDIYFSLIFLSTMVLIATFIMFDTHITLEKKLFGFRFGAVEEIDEESGKEPEILPSEIIIAEQEKLVKAEKATEPVVIKEKTGEENFLSGLIGFRKKGPADQFTPPPLALLERDSGKPGVGDIKANSNIIKRTLANFGINVEMDEISIGPSVTRYALKPAEGVKLARIVGLQNDLALALAAHPIRIEAPIPGKSLVGIEIPNKVKSTVGLATLLDTKEFAESDKPLLVALGKGISGIPHFGNVAKAPHMLIAGTTGSGKSVTIHTIITSMLYRNSPEKLRFIMVDPKRVELTLYNKIPHLLTPVITEPKKTILALRWAAKEMDRRYDILESHACKDIWSYHKNILEKALLRQAEILAGDEEPEEVERMPYICIVIDELADIMMTYPKELESAIVRLAQMSRAVGIHLILSTQRPSVEVITGLIKANIPTRVALQVASQIDSRTIIDMAGAEKLLGQGDMLYLSSEMSKPVRLQSAFISEVEVKGVVKWLIEHYANEVPPAEINFGIEEKHGSLVSSALSGGSFGDEDDDLYEDARQAIMEAGKASASYLQRKLKVGYARAARLLDMLEERGVIGPGDGAKAREVYGQGGGVTDEPFEPVAAVPAQPEQIDETGRPSNSFFS